jgi:hypothetical protein
VDQIDVAYSFYDDPDFVADADRDSQLLKRWHERLWSKALPSGERLTWVPAPGSYLTADSSHGPLRVSSDTIATTHAGYASAGITHLWSELEDAEKLHIERALYTIGGFIIFPTRPQSLNQRRGTDSRIADRFDLTLECIRGHYVGQSENPLADVIQADANYFRLFGDGSEGFSAFVDFFHLQDLLIDGSVRWLDVSSTQVWDFDAPPLPTSAPAHRRYLDNVLTFVSARNQRIKDWCSSQSGE